MLKLIEAGCPADGTPRFVRVHGVIINPAMVASIIPLPNGSGAALTFDGHRTAVLLTADEWSAFESHLAREYGLVDL